MTVISEEVKFNGVLHSKQSRTKFKLTRYPPSEDLSFFIERYWIVQWDLRGQEPYLQETLPNPCVNMVIEKNKSHIYGAVKRKSSHLLENQGRVFGVKFKPGAFYPFVKESIVSMRSKETFSFLEAFGVDEKPLETAVLSMANEENMVAHVEEFIREKLPDRDEKVVFINRIVDHIAMNRELTKVDEIVIRFQVSKRTLQRLFNQYVGVNPKWVIKQNRLQEAAELMAEGQIVDGSKLAADLGYFDQSHFTKEFKTIVGCSPTEYVLKYK